MAFVRKTWKDRVAEYINRRILTKEDGKTELVSVERDEGTISQEGDAFNANNMNDLEQRIANEFNEQNLNIIDVNKRLMALEQKFSNYTPVDSLSGSFVVGGLENEHSIDKVITFSPAFGSIPTVTVGITTQEHKYAYVSVSEITQGSCKITVRNGHSTEYYSNIGVSWSAVANA